MMSAPTQAGLPGSGGEASPAELSGLFHRLNNQLGIILANAELLESRLTDTTQRARAGQVVSSVLEAIATVQQVRRATDTAPASDK
jgi:GAF domain-containing protein